MHRRDLDDVPAADKAALRDHFRAQAQALAKAPHRSAGAGARVALYVRSLLAGCRQVGLYCALDHEVDTLPLARALWADNVATYAPQVHGRHAAAALRFCRWHPDAALVRHHGILQPPADAAPVAIVELPAVVVPGLAFDARGGRLGQGWGCYDRALAGYAGLVVGLAHLSQLTSRLPHEDHDRRVDVVVTQLGVWWARGQLPSA